MTKEQINREIAEKVMGAPNPYPTWFLRGDDWYMLPEDVPAYWECYFYFDPMHRIEHAWIVVEKLKAIGYYIEIGIHPDETEVYCALVGNKYKDVIDKLRKESFSASTDTAQEAICLAALKAKEGENE